MKFRNFTNIKSLLLDNRTVKQTIFKNTFWTYLGTGISTLISFVLIIYIARILGATEYGKFTFALAFIFLFGVLSDLGLSQIIIREFAREKEREKEFYSIISLKILLGLGMFIAILVGSFFITSDPVIQKIILILALYFFIKDTFIGLSYSFFQARQRMEYQAWVEIFVALVMAIFVFLVIFNFPSVENLSYAYLSAISISLVFVAIFFHLKVLPLKIFWDKSVWRKFLLMSWPLAFAALFGALYTHIDSVMLGSRGMITETGWYNAAHKIARMSFIFTGIVCGSIYPVLSESFKKSKEKLQKVWNFQTELMIILAFPLIIGGIVLAPKIIDVIYGPGFAPSILAFQILIIMAGIILLSVSLHQILIVSNQQKKIFWAVLGGAVINIALNLILIPKYSLYGAAVATVITQSIIFLLLFKFTMKFTSIRPPYLRFLYIFIGVLISSTVMFLVISRPQIYHLSIFFSIPIGLFIYLVCFLSYQKLTGQPLLIIKEK